MSAIAVFLDLKIYSVVFLLLLVGPIGTAKVNWWDGEAMKLMVKLGSDIIKSTFPLIDSIEYIKQKNFNKPSFEVGYLMFTTFEVYRKMIDKYNTSHTMNKLLYTQELVIYLEEIENHYWEVDHLSAMMHEIEKKYNITTGLDTKYREITSAEIRANHEAEQLALKKYRDRLDGVKSRKKKKLLYRLTPFKRPPVKSGFPIEYGWDYNDSRAA